MNDLDTHVLTWINIIIMLNEKCKPQNDMYTGNHLYEVQKTIILYPICEHKYTQYTDMHGKHTHKLQSTGYLWGEQREQCNQGATTPPITFLFFFLIFYFVLGYSRLTNNAVVVSDEQWRAFSHTYYICIHSPPTLFFSYKRQCISIY